MIGENPQRMQGSSDHPHGRDARFDRDPPVWAPLLLLSNGGNGLSISIRSSIVRAGAERIAQPSDRHHRAEPGRPTASAWPRGAGPGTVARRAVVWTQRDRSNLSQMDNPLAANCPSVA
jgi:hypothetical protein